MKNEEDRNLPEDEEEIFLVNYKNELRFFASKEDRKMYLDIKERTGLDIDFVIDYEIIVLKEKLKTRDLTRKEIAFFFIEFGKAI